MRSRRPPGASRPLRLTFGALLGALALAGIVGAVGAVGGERVAYDTGWRRGPPWPASQALPTAAGGAALVGLGLGFLVGRHLHRRNQHRWDEQRALVRKLQELDQAKADFVSSVTHELRTPLTSIVGYVEMLRDRELGEVGPEQDRVLAVIGRNTERLQLLIEDLLTLSHIESNELELALAPVEPGETLRAALTGLSPTAAERSQRLLTRIDDPLPAVTGDARQLERVARNLIGNAIKFTPDGGQITVSLGVGSDGHVTLAVTDTGIGIPEPEQERVFSRFFRSSTTQQHGIPGTGLGLVIVKEIVDRHGGSVTVTSSPGVGSTFVVRLPATAAPVDRTAQGQARA